MRQAKFSEIKELKRQGFTVEMVNGKVMTNAPNPVKSPELIQVEQQYIYILSLFNLTPQMGFGQIFGTLDAAQANKTVEEKQQILEIGLKIKAIADQIRILGSQPHLATGVA